MAAPAGHGHSILHNKLQSVLQAMMKLEGVSSEKEAASLILDKVGDPYITAYATHVPSHTFVRKAPHSIIPDLHAHKLPTGRQRMNDSGETSSAKALFEVKTYTVYNSRYRHNNTKGPPKR